VSDVNRALMEEVTAMLSSHRFERISEVYAEAAVFEDVAMAAVCEGWAAIRQFFDHSVTAFPDFSMTLRGCSADAKTGASEWTMAGTNSGHAFGFAATGRLISIRGASIFRFAGGRIAQQRDYWSLQMLNAQLGIKTSGD